MFRFVRLCVDHQRGVCPHSALQCDNVHICCSFVAFGHCANGNSCALGHRIEGTILEQLPFPPQWHAEEKLKFVRECHPCVCADYNSDFGCTRDDECLKLHVCNVLFHEPQCANHKCAPSLSHQLFDEHCNRIYKHHMASPITFRAALRNLFPYPIMPLQAVRERSANIEASAALSPTASATCSDEPTRTQPADPHAPQNRASSAQSDADFGIVDPNCDDILAFLIARGGKCFWQELCSHLSPNTSSYHSLKGHLQKVHTRSKTGNRSAFINILEYTNMCGVTGVVSIVMYRFVQLCGFWHRGQSCRDGSRCSFLHVCRDWIAGVCAAGPECPGRHSFDSTNVLLLPFPKHFRDEDKREFIRSCHPTVCIDYNSPAGCGRGDSCPDLHLCNSFIRDRCPKHQCKRSHVLNAPDCRDIYKRFDICEDKLPHMFRFDFRALIMPIKVPERRSDSPRFSNVSFCSLDAPRFSSVSSENGEPNRKRSKQSHNRNDFHKDDVPDSTEHVPSTTVKIEDNSDDNHLEHMRLQAPECLLPNAIPHFPQSTRKQHSRVSAATASKLIS